VHDLVQPLSLHFVVEDDAAQLLSIERAVGEENFISECCLYLREPGRSGFNDLAGYYVGIDNRDMCSFEEIRNRRFAGRDTSCQSNYYLMP